jgi:hypothetical protein
MLIAAPLACCAARKGASIVARKGARVVARKMIRTGVRLATLGLLLRLTRPWA